MVVVFVHGIFSTCEVFATLRQEIEQKCPWVDRTLDFSYPFLEPLKQNAMRLNAFLAAQIPPGEEVAIVAHSMGGLVSRMALLTGHATRSYKIPFLIMLATPNHGAIKMNQINGLADLVRRAVGKIAPIDSRSRGLDDLTRVNSILNDLIVEDRDAIMRTKAVDYVTIPALRYNEDYPYDEEPPSAWNSKALSFLASLSARRGPIQLDLPHDGVVEETSVRMVTAAALYQNERSYYSTGAGKRSIDRTANVHVIHPDLRHANHIEVHSIPRVCSLVTRILNSKGIDPWIEALDEEERALLHLSNGELI